MVDLRNTKTDSQSNTAVAALNEHIQKKQKRKESKKEFAERKKKSLIQDIKNQNQMIMSKLEEKLTQKKKVGKRIIAYQEEEDTDNNENVPVIGQGETDLSDIIEEHKFSRDEEAQEELQRSTYKLDDSDEDESDDDADDEPGGGPDLGINQIIDDGLDV